MTLLGRGFGLCLRSPRLLLLGLIPALVAFAVLTTAFVVLCVLIGSVTDAVTPFADGWADGWRVTVRVVAGIAVLGAALLVAVLLYTTLALAIGDPFYERIARRAEEPYGGVPGEVELPFWRSLRRGIGDALRLVLVSLVSGVLLFGAGFLPVVGQTVVPVLGATVGGWFLALELTGVPFERRGMGLTGRRRVLRGRRALTVGFGTGVFVLFMIPLGAVLAMPGAVAGAALLSRRALGDPLVAPAAPSRPGAR